MATSDPRDSHDAFDDRLLDELRDHDDTSGVPNYDPPAELRIILDP